MAKLNDKQRKRIIADRVEGMTIRKLAEKYQVSTTTIQKVLKAHPEIVQKVTKKKEQNTLDMLAFLDAQKVSAQEFILMAMEALKDPEKLNRTGAQALATAMGIVIDKFTQAAPKAEDEGVTIVWGKQQ